MIESQIRSMRYNLIIKGIPDVENNTEQEDTEAKVQTFRKGVLGFNDEIKFQVVHRLKPNPNRKQRNIIAKFERRKDWLEVATQN